jgi:hypothetical protein
LFNDAWEWGAISREHLFKKNGNVIVSTAPYRKATCKGMGEYLHSRYWVNWDFLRELQVGVSESTPPSQIGVSESTTPVSENDTKGLIEVFSLTTNWPPSVRQSPPDSEVAVGVDGYINIFPPQSSAGGYSSPFRPPLGGDGSVAARAFSETPKSAAPQENREERTDRIIAADRLRQLERKMSDAEIYREYKAVFDRVNQDSRLSLTWTPPKQSHRKKAAEFYRAVGGAVAVAKWEKFLIESEFDVPQPEFDEEQGKVVTITVQRTWLLLAFVQECS